MRQPLRVPRGVKEMPAPGPMRILALSGGGYRGLFSADVLSRLEVLLGPDLPDRFDLFAGTSVGGLIAAGLAIGREPQVIRDAIAEHGPAIFDDRVSVGPVLLYRKPKGHLGALVRSKFKPAALEKAIGAILGEDAERKVADVPRPLLLVATCATTKSPFLMSSLRPNSPGAQLALKTALRATSAAPGYFPAVDLELRTLVDGGLVANAPELVAAAELAEIRKAEPANLRILSIGTAAPDPGAVPDPIRGRGLARWLVGDLVPLTLDAQEKLVTAQAAALFGESYIRINAAPSGAQAEVLDLDLATDESTRTLLHLAEEAVAKLPIASVKGLLGIR
jgi:uncharacterized protein